MQQSAFFKVGKYRCCLRVPTTLLTSLLLCGSTFAADSSDAFSDSPKKSALIPGWSLRVLDLGLDARFNYMDRYEGPVTDRGLQYRLRTHTRLDFSKSGNTFLVFRAETGKGFDNSWNNTGVGLGSGQSIFNLKSVALHQKIGNWLEAEAGGLDFDRGAGTDAIYASGDGHMTGYRATFTDKSGRRPNKIAFTAGYVGDFDKPNFFSRARMNEVNYIQFLVQQHFGENIQASAEMDSIRNTVYARSAVTAHKVWLLDSAVLETVARASGPVLFSWSSTVSRNWDSNALWRSDLIYADLPARFYIADGQRIFFNRGEIDIGRRLASGLSRRVTPDCEIGLFGGRLLNSVPSKGWIAQAGISYRFEGLVNRLLH